MSTFVGFHAKKSSPFEEFYAKPIKKVHFCRISRWKKVHFCRISREKGPLLSDFTLKKVQFFQIVRVELCLLIHIPNLDQFKGGQCPPCPPYKKNPVQYIVVLIYWEVIEIDVFAWSWFLIGDIFFCWGGGGEIIYIILYKYFFW